MAKNDDWVAVDVQGVARWMFHRAPHTDKEFGTTAFKTDLVLNEDSKARVDFGDWVTGLDNVIDLLEDYKIKVKDKNGAHTIQFKSKVENDGSVLMNKPIVKDAKNNDFPEGTFIGNGSVVVVRGALRNYKKTPPLKGRQPMTPFFKAVQVLDLVEYKRWDLVTEAFRDELEYAVFGSNRQMISKKKLDRLWDIAWDMGHSSGYSEVYNYYVDLSDLIDPNF